MDFSITFGKIEEKIKQQTLIIQHDILFDIEEIVSIFFTINSSYNYRLELYCRENKWKPNRVFHSTTTPCPYCDIRSSECLFLTNFSEKIVKGMMKNSSLRLKILSTLGVIST
jgi:hypothetical protein